MSLIYGFATSGFIFATKQNDLIINIQCCNFADHKYSVLQFRYKECLNFTQLLSLYSFMYTASMCMPLIFLNNSQSSWNISRNRFIVLLEGIW